MRTRHLLCLPIAALAICACGGDLDDGTVVDVVRPDSVGVLELSATFFDLAGVTALAARSGDDALAGTADGWSRYRGAAFVSVTDVGATTAADRGPDRGYLVAGSSGLFAVESETTPSPIQDHLGTEVPGALAAEASVTWLGTSTRLYRLDDDGLLAFDGIDASSAISTAGDVVVARGAVGITALQRIADGWEQIDLGAVDVAAPFSGGRIAATTNGALLEWTGGSWTPIALSDDREAPGATGLEHVQSGPDGSLWIIGANNVFRYDGTNVDAAPRPSIGPIVRATVASDGTLWIASDDQIARLKEERRAVTFADDIDPFYAANCERCHKENGIGHRLDGYQLWVDEIDQIVEELETGRMPQDGQALIGSIETIRQWRDEGYAP